MEGVAIEADQKNTDREGKKEIKREHFIERRTARDMRQCYLS